ncbi:zinc ribbon domain-containing protein [Bacillus cereus]|uniref:zinc ribbon domain-containing protein n=1 Tax=Bacillus cereus TaxID=1396 RepID=UPI003CD0C5FB
MKKISGLQAVWKGRDLIIAPKNYASSQLYSCCGYKNKDVKKLNLLEWDCPCCGTHYDKDINQASTCSN